MSGRPYIVVIGGPNGAGKSSIAREVLADTFGVIEFVNADAIAAGLAGFNPERAAFAAGRVMLTRLKELADSRATFAFESTLASKTFAVWLDIQIASGYDVHLVYVALKSSRLAVRRVKRRVGEGGHSIPTGTIIRRFARSAGNLLQLYIPLATTWRIFENSSTHPVLAATGGIGLETLIALPDTWRNLHEAAAEASKDQQTGGRDDANG